MEFIRDYIRSIAIFLIFSAFVGIILPNEKYKDYIQLVLGLILILIILKPLTGKRDWSAAVLDRLPELTATADQTELQAYAETRDRMVVDLYKSRLKDQIAALVEAKTGFKAEETEVDIGQETGEPVRIELLLSPKEAEPTPVPFIRIQEVNLTGGNRDESENISAGQKAEEENIKNIVADFYNLSVDNIHIRVQRKKQE